MNKEKRKTRLPSPNCVICERTLDEVGGGYRIIAQQLRGLALSPTPSNDYVSGVPHKSYFLNDNDGYLVVWGEPELWTKEAIDRARQEYLDVLRPWMCQRCARRGCSECGAPINYPMGSDVLYDSGCSSHVAIFPFDPGCTNTECKKYREWEFSTR